MLNRANAALLATSITAAMSTLAVRPSTTCVTARTNQDHHEPATVAAVDNDTCGSANQQPWKFLHGSDGGYSYRRAGELRCEQRKHRESDTIAEVREES
jgi:hypothetical protein